MEKKTLSKEERIAHNLKVLQGIAKFSKAAMDRMKAKADATARNKHAKEKIVPHG